MSLAEEMLATMSASDDSSTYLSEEEPHIIIDNSRTAFVPSSLKTIAVTGDHEVEKITFDCVRFWDGNDLSTFAIYLNYVLPDLSTGTYIPSSIVADNNVFHFDWDIKNNITKKSGKIAFAITAIKTKKNDSGETVVDKQWSSIPNGDCSIVLGIDISNVPSEEESSDVLAQMSDILEQMQPEINAIKSELSEFVYVLTQNKLEQGTWENGAKAGTIKFLRCQEKIYAPVGSVIEIIPNGLYYTISQYTSLSDTTPTTMGYLGGEKITIATEKPYFTIAVSNGANYSASTQIAISDYVGSVVCYKILSINDINLRINNQVGTYINKIVPCVQGTIYNGNELSTSNRIRSAEFYHCKKGDVFVCESLRIALTAYDNDKNYQYEIGFTPYGFNSIQCTHDGYVRFVFAKNGDVDITPSESPYVSCYNESLPSYDMDILCGVESTKLINQTIERGNNTVTGTSDDTTQNRARTKGFVEIPANTKLIAYNGAQFYLFYYRSKNAQQNVSDKNSGAWITEYTFTENCYVRLSLRYSDNRDIYNYEQLRNNYHIIPISNSNIDKPLWKRKTISNGVEYDNKYRVSSGYYNVKRGDSVTVLKRGTYRVNISFYSALTSDSFIKDTGWMSKDEKYIFDGDYYIRVTIAFYRENEEILPEEGENIKINFVSEDTITQELIEISNAKPKYNFPLLLKVAHRGYHVGGYENTLSAFENAKSNGFNAIETDLHWTSDGIPVLCHNATIDETSTGTGRIDQMTYEQLLQYDFGGGQKIPTLQQYLCVCKKYDMIPFLEIKADLTSDRAKTVVDMCRKFGVIDRIVFLGFYQPSLWLLNAECDNLNLSPLVTTVKANTPKSLYTSLKTKSNRVYLSTEYANVTNDLLDACDENNIDGLMAYTVNDATVANDLIDKVVAVTSDNAIWNN